MRLRLVPKAIPPAQPVVRVYDLHPTMTLVLAQRLLDAAAEQGGLALLVTAAGHPVEVDPRDFSSMTLSEDPADQ